MYVGWNISKQETTETEPQFINLGGAEYMSLGDRKEAIELRIRPGIRQIGVGTERLGYRPFVPEPGAGDFILAVTEASFVADGMLVVQDGRHSAELTSESPRVVCSNPRKRTNASPLTIARN